MHCKKPWYQQADAVQAAAPVPRTSGGGGKASGSAPSAPGVTRQDLLQMLQLCNKIGDTKMAASAQAQLDRLDSAPLPPQVRADAAHKEIQRLENKLRKDLEGVHTMEQKLALRKEDLEKTLEELDRHDVDYRAAIAELHQATVSPPVDASTPVLRLQDILDGKETFQVDDGDLFGLGEFQDLTKEDLDEAKSRKDILKAKISEITTKLFGEVKAMAAEKREQHQVQQKRLEAKKRKTDGEKSERAASAPPGAAAGSGLGPPTPGGASSSPSSQQPVAAGSESGTSVRAKARLAAARESKPEAAAAAEARIGSDSDNF